MSNSEPALRTLLDQRELYDLALRYARAADRRDYPAFAEIFTEAGRISVHHRDVFGTEPIHAMEDRATIVRSMKGLEAYEKTQHLVANQLMEIDGDRASGETYCTAHHIYRVDEVPMNLTMFIRYQDRCVREGGRWWFEERRLCVDWERHGPLGDDGWA